MLKGQAPVAVTYVRTCLHAERELAALEDSQARVEELEADRDALLESISGDMPEDLDRLTGEEPDLPPAAARGHACT